MIERQSLKTRFKAIYQGEGVLGFLIAVLIFGIATGLFAGVLNNFLHEILNIDKSGRGVVEFPRELPGLLLFIIVAVLYRFSELKVMYLALVISLVGLLGLGFLGVTVVPGIMFIFLWSMGEHMMMPIRDSMAMHMARPGKEGRAMGGVGSARNIGQLAGYYLVPLVFIAFRRFFPEAAESVPFRFTYFLGAFIIVIGIIAVTRIRKKEGHVEREKISFNRKFLKYYILEMFFGARKQVFLTFAPYVLIIYYGAKTEYIAFLYGLWSLGNIFLNPLLGRLIDKLGYKKIIVADTILLVVLCFIYGFIHSFVPKDIAFIIVSVTFVIDAMLFMVGMARAKYVKDLSDSKEEVTTTLSTGISINHLVSIVIAIGGGFIWEALGVRILFSIAGLFGLGSFIFSITLPKPKPQEIPKPG